MSKIRYSLPEGAISTSRPLFLISSCLVTVVLSAAAYAENSSESEGALIQTPVAFTENRGQWDGQVLFRAKSGVTTMWFTKEGIYYQFLRPKSEQPARLPDSSPRQSLDLEQLVIGTKFVGANENCVIVGEGLMEYKCNYFLGNDQSNWQTDVPNYESITYEGLYSGIDLTFYNQQGRVGCEFAIAKNADPNQVKIVYEGVKSISVNSEADLVIESHWGNAVETSPSAFQRSVPVQAGIQARYDVIAPLTVQLNIGGVFNRSEELFMAPSLTFSTYLGGSDSDSPSDMAVNISGETVIAGSSWSTSFPVVSGYDMIHGGAGSTDAFVTKFNANGNGLVFSTFLGGSSNDNNYAMVLTGSGNFGIFLTGSTSSSNFPLPNALDQTLGGSQDVFVAILNLSGNGLTFATFLGGSDDEVAGDIAIRCVTPCTVDRYTVWVCGTTYSTDFPTSNAYSSTLSGPNDVFLTQYSLGQTGHSMGRSTYFGGNDDDNANSVVMAGGTSGKPIITGQTRSTDFPTANAYDNSRNGNGDAFISGFDYAGNGQIFPLFSTYLGGTASNYAEMGLDLIIRTSGNLLVAGNTQSTDFPTMAAYDASHNGNTDVFLTELNSTASALVSSSYFGGTLGELFNDLAIDKFDQVFLAGSTGSSNLPLVNPYDASLSSSDGFVAKFNSALQQLQFSTLIGGSDQESVYSIAFDTLGCLYMTGPTNSTNFPLVNPYDPTNNSYDAFLTKICLPAYTCGDADGNGIVSISDAVFLINYIFAGGPAPSPLLAGDADCNGLVTISDAVYLINFIFAGGPAPCASCP